MKDDKTYVGRAFERCFEFIFKDIKPENPYKSKISEEEFNKIYEDAKIAYDQIYDYFDGIDSLVWTGSYVSSTSSDLLINKKLIEIKYLKGNFGSTWINTTINAIHDEYGFPRLYNWYMKEYDVYGALEDEIGRTNVSKKNMSPVGQAEASKIMKERPEFYKEYQEIELDARRALVYDIVEYLNSHEDKLEDFCNGILTKSICGNKKMPEYLIEYNYTEKKAVIKTKDELLEMLGDRKIKYEKDTCQFHIGKFRVGFTWKNGVGLFNPVIKVYI